jgi:hypothetical protein
MRSSRDRLGLACARLGDKLVDKRDFHLEQSPRDLGHGDVEIGAGIFANVGTKRWHPLDQMLLKKRLLRIESSHRRRQVVGDKGVLRRLAETGHKFKLEGNVVFGDVEMVGPVQSLSE